MQAGEVKMGQWGPSRCWPHVDLDTERTFFSPVSPSPAHTPSACAHRVIW